MLTGKVNINTGLSKAETSTSVYTIIDEGDLTNSEAKDLCNQMSATLAVIEVKEEYTSENFSKLWA